MDLTNGERAVISVLIQQMEGVDKNDARMVVALSDKLNLNDQQSYSVAQQDDSENYDLANVELFWLKDLLNEAFRQRKVPPFVAKHALSLSGKLEDVDGS